MFCRQWAASTVRLSLLGAQPAEKSALVATVSRTCYITWQRTAETDQLPAHIVHIVLLQTLSYSDILLCCIGLQLLLRLLNGERMQISLCDVLVLHF